MRQAGRGPSINSYRQPLPELPSGHPACRRGVARLAAHAFCFGISGATAYLVFGATFSEVST